MVEVALAQLYAACRHRTKTVGAEVERGGYCKATEIEGVAELAGIRRIERRLLGPLESDGRAELIVGGMRIAGEQLAVADRVAAAKANVPIRVAFARQRKELVVVEPYGAVEAVATPIGVGRDAPCSVRAPAAGVRSRDAVHVRIVEDRLVQVRTDGKAADLNAGFFISRANSGEHRDTQILIVTRDADREIRRGCRLCPGRTCKGKDGAGAQKDPCPILAMSR